MTKVSVMYPNAKGAHFDMAHSCAKHLPMLQRLLGPALLSIEVDKESQGWPWESRLHFLR